VEGNCVHWPYVVFIVDGLSMALESIFLLLRFGAGIEEFHSYSAFDRAGRIPLQGEMSKTRGEKPKRI
jgi:hypothetical protein